MEAFFGDWILVSSENVDEYMTEIGGEQIDKILISISQEGDMVVMKTKMGINSFETSIVLGEKFDEYVHNIQCKSVVNLDGDKLVHVRKSDDTMFTHIREIKDGKMIVTATCGDSVAVGTYERVSEVA